MKKHELLNLLSGVDDDAQIVLWIPTKVADSATFYDAFRIKDVGASTTLGLIVSEDEIIAGDDSFDADEHDTDSACIVSDKTDCCIVCGVHRGDPCPTCGGKSFHNPGCREYK
jgi:hypothetical protein